MSDTFLSFVDRHASREAFIGNRLGRLVDLIDSQGEALLRARGVTFRSTAASAVLLLDERRELSIADIARELRQPHQLVTQRIEGLLDLGLVESGGDPRDGRRKVLKLTRRGRKQAELLNGVLRDAEAAFLDLYREIDASLSEIALAVAEALLRRPLTKRVEGAESDEFQTDRVAP